MTPDQINQAIAEACGWVRIEDPEFPDEFLWKLAGASEAHSDLPDYCHDLNAMHEAVNSLTSSDRVSWIGWMHKITKDEENPMWLARRLIEAKPDKWAEAFLRTLGKWEEET